MRTSEYIDYLEGLKKLNRTTISIDSVLDHLRNNKEIHPSEKIIKDLLDSTEEDWRCFDTSGFNIEENEAYTDGHKYLLKEALKKQQ